MEAQEIELLSPYVAEQLRRYPALLTEAAPPLAGGDEEELLRNLRHHKHHGQVRLVLDLLEERLSQEQFLAGITALTEKIIDAALSWYHRQLVERYGDPGQSMTVLGLGKLGGGELNFSSDIDLIFCFERWGEVRRGSKVMETPEFFTKLARKLIAALDQITGDGGLYRVDMRLRPFGQSGALVFSHEGLEQYYAMHGRDWERYALMKARPVAGDLAAGQRVLKRLRPFIYRRYLDYQALQSIGQMKNAINQQINDAALDQNIKLGRGGIREAEFAVQAMQMVYGGQYGQLQRQNFLEALGQLELLQFWPATPCRQLREAYLLLRTVENGLQFKHEEQTHQLPADEADWPRLARIAGCRDVAELRLALSQARDFIHRWFNGIFAKESQDGATIDWQKEEEIQGLNINGEVKAALLRFCGQLNWVRLSKNSVGHLAKILNQISALTTTDGLPPLLRLLGQVATRSAYLFLLAEHQDLVSHLLEIGQKSQWLMDFIIEHPLVLDDILTGRPLLQGEALRQELQRRTAAGQSDEEFFYGLRDFQHGQIFKIAWQDIHGFLPLMQVSDRLTELAELILAESFQRVYRQLSQRHGRPRHSDGREAQFAIIAYGKLGGLELSYGSDLDLIFLYEDGTGGQSDGAKPLENNVFFTRLAQRLITYLSSASTSGQLYQIDTRLRPNGKSGLLISSLEAYDHYQREQAQTWEHQALTRARFIYGSAALRDHFQRLRGAILAQERDGERLRQEVLAMREKISAGHRAAPPGQFDLKYGRGGLVDIEFIVQYLLLRHCGREPILGRMSDNIRQLAALEATGLLSSSQAMTLRDSYRRLRLQCHRLLLNKQENLVAAGPWQENIDEINAIWQEIFAVPPTSS